ncbi:uncharacterized protein LOC112054379 [Bicyclus anynana]|uniref:Uncharacterized protein LOC112054379 n=1 Tax=Bicyclus anynana TaxID=110368 RepID=A0ABM3M3D9_BICAN|nr:uncharacterized protein LOC112054379 [Bicyclus anynana]
MCDGACSCRRMLVQASAHEGNAAEVYAERGGPCCSQWLWYMLWHWITMGVMNSRRQDDPKAQDDKATEDPNSEDTSMKIKLFRLMFETIKDSDLKVRRAELVKAQYGNYSTFEIGFLIGDITDKLNVVTDISLTLKKMYAEWKPMEHINAYEQIANKAIEISHLIDVVKIVHKKITNKHEKESVEGQ